MICLAQLDVIFLLRKSDIAPDVAVIFYSPLSFQTRVAHITAEGNITHEVHIARRRRIELAHLIYRRCAIGCFLYFGKSYLEFILFISKITGKIDIKRCLCYNQNGVMRFGGCETELYNVTEWRQI